MKILGVTITNGLSVSPHVQSVIVSCAQVLYALRVLRAMVYVTVHCKLYITLLLLPSSAMHLVPGKASLMPQILIKFNRSSIKVKDLDTVHLTYLILKICVPQ